MVKLIYTAVKGENHDYSGDVNVTNGITLYDTVRILLLHLNKPQN